MSERLLYLIKGVVDKTFHILIKGTITISLTTTNIMATILQ